MMRQKRLPWVLTLLFFVTFSAPAWSAEDPLCTAPNVLIVFDVSGSMGLALPGTKYTEAVNAVVSVTQQMDQEVRFGLMMFPKPDGQGCDMANQFQVPFALGQSDSFYNLLDPAGTNFWGGPTSLHDTPMYQALDFCVGHPDFLDPTYRGYVLLITDGKQDCCKSGDYDSDPDCLPNSTEFEPVEAAENRADLVERVQALVGQGVKVYVVGFGENVDGLALNQMAVEGLTPKDPSCNPEQTDPQALDNCYYPAMDGAAIQDAMAEITLIVTDELCNGLDDDCDGETDEVWPELGEECDGLDGDTCRYGTVVCDETELSTVCDEAGPGFSEACNGVDDNCSAGIDEDWPTLGEACDGNDADDCANGVVVCNAEQNGVECLETGPGSSELCNGADDDCDGGTDEDWADALGGACDGADGDACANGTYACKSDGSGVECYEPGEGLLEVCNGQDDNCDGLIDEGDLCEPGTICFEGSCVPDAEPTPEKEPTEKSGCGCQIDGKKSDTPWTMFAVVGLFAGMLWRTRRRMSP